VRAGRRCPQARGAARACLAGAPTSAEPPPPPPTWPPFGVLRAGPMAPAGRFAALAEWKEISERERAALIKQRRDEAREERWRVQQLC